MFRGTPPPKPLKCKSVSNQLGARFRSRWADPIGEESKFLCAIFSFATTDIIETSLCYYSQTVHLSLLPFTISFRETKNPASNREAGLGRKLLLVTTLPACPGSNWESAHNGTGLPIGLGRIHSRGWRDHDVSRLTRPVSSSSSWLICSCSFSSNVREVYTRGWLQSTYTLRGSTIFNSNIRMD